jgi:hypothetical protein
MAAEDRGGRVKPEDREDYEDAATTTGGAWEPIVPYE